MKRIRPAAIINLKLIVMVSLFLLFFFSFQNLIMLCCNSRVKTVFIETETERGERIVEHLVYFSFGNVDQKFSMFVLIE